MGFIDVTTLSTVLGTMFDPRSIRPFKPAYVFDAAAQARTWNQNTNPTRGATIVFPVLSALSTNTAALTPTTATLSGGSALTYTRRSVSLELYGNHSTLDTIESHNETFIDDFSDAAWQLADQGMASLNILARVAMDKQKFGNEVSGTVSSTYNLYGSSGTATHIGPLKSVDIRNVVSKLRANNVPSFSDGLYHAIITPAQYTQLRSDSDAAGWSETAKYVGKEELFMGDMGVFEGVRFIVNNEVLGKGTATTTSYFFGEDFVGKAIGYDLRVGTKSTLDGPHENLLSMYWDALVGYKIIRRESGYLIHTSATAA
jgi:N4-gp56 family major capsid protein